MQTGVIIAIVVCVSLTILAVVLGVYFGKVACPSFGSDCPAPPPPPTGTPPSGTPPTGTPPTGASYTGTPSTQLGTLTSTPDAVATAPNLGSSPPPPPPPPPPSSIPCPTGKWSNTGLTPCNTCSEPTPTQYVTAICTSTQNTQVSPIACPAGSSTQNFDTGSSSRLGTRTCVQDVAPTVVPQGQPCPPGQQIVNGICNVCPPGYNYNSLIHQCYAEI